MQVQNARAHIKPTPATTRARADTRSRRHCARPHSSGFMSHAADAQRAMSAATAVKTITVRAMAVCVQTRGVCEARWAREAVDWMWIIHSGAIARVDGVMMRTRPSGACGGCVRDVGVKWWCRVCTDIVMRVLMRVIDWEEPCETEQGDDDARFESRVSRRGARGR